MAHSAPGHRSVKVPFRVQGGRLDLI